MPAIDGTGPSSALVTPPGAGYQNADRVAVTADDTQVPAQTDLYAGQDASVLLLPLLTGAKQFTNLMDRLGRAAPSLSR